MENRRRNSGRRTLSVFSPKAREVFEQYNFIALRDKRNGFLINVATSEEGLIWSTDLRKKERYVFYKDANPVMHKYATIVGEAKYKLIFKGDLTRHPQYEIEDPYIPMDHYRNNGDINPFFQINEFRISQRGMKFTMNYDYFLKNLDKKKYLAQKEEDDNVFSLKIEERRIAA